MVSNFSYEGYAARLLTYQETVSACGAGTTSATGYLDNCKYFMENTRYSSNSLEAYWLETPYSPRPELVGMIAGNSRVSSFVGALNKNGYGVRPAIEVPKSKISY